MSGNSCCRCRQTAPIVCTRCWERTCVALKMHSLVARAETALRAQRGTFGQTGRVAYALRSSLQEGEPVFADLDFVAVLESRGLDALAVHEGAVETTLVLDVE